MFESPISNNLEKRHLAAAKEIMTGLVLKNVRYNHFYQSKVVNVHN